VLAAVAADVVVERAVAEMVVAPHAGRLQQLQLRRTPHRIFLPTRMPCRFLLRHPRAVVAEAADVVAEVAQPEAMWRP
jgi:hypothetical protein